MFCSIVNVILLSNSACGHLSQGEIPDPEVVEGSKLTEEDKKCFESALTSKNLIAISMTTLASFSTYFTHEISNHWKDSKNPWIRGDNYIIYALG